MNISEKSIDKGYFQDLKDHIRHNYQIAEFYENLYADTGFETFNHKSKSVDSCCKFWDLDYYRFQSVKDIKRVNLCKDKFCFNCQSMLAISRQSKFAPILDSFKSDYKICHMIVTVPNCDGDELLPLLDKMYKKFPFFMRYFKGKAKVKGINFLKYGYGGAVRGLEITQNQDTKQFHPHFHCMVLFSKNVDLSPKYKNSYSYDRDYLIRKFSELEILLQKIWFLLMNDCKVTQKAISELKEGYSIIVEDSQGYYHECFKYACKGAFDIEKGAFIYKEPVFRILYEALNNRRMIQGYGKLHNFDDIDREIIESELVEEYSKLVSELQSIEKPEFYIESLDEVIERSVACKYISKSNLRRILISRKEEILQKHKKFTEDFDENFNFDKEENERAKK